MLKPMILAIALAAAPVALRAETADTGATVPDTDLQARIIALSDVLRMPDIFDVMAAEGQDYGLGIEEQMFPGQGGARWTAEVGTIYDTAAMRARFDAALAKALSGDAAAIDAAHAFFGSDLGQEIIKLEIAARQAMTDIAVEEAAQVEVQKLETERSSRLKAIRKLIAASDLIEMNVAGSLSASLAFYDGMASVEGFADKAARERMMADVWQQEAQVRADNAAWLYPFMVLAYQPLSDSDLDSYIVFSESPEGKRLNTALFTAFDAVILPISRDIGRAAAQMMQSNEI